MLKVGLVGLGFMGRVHVENYIRLESEGFPVKLVAVCDIDSSKFSGRKPGGNIETSDDILDLSNYSQYTGYDQMLETEKLDYVDITLPTYLHAEYAIKALNSGLHVLCEKPMALNSGDCARMIEASVKSGKKLMIGQCLRFWPEYEYLKECVETGRYGKVTCAYFFRGGSSPVWSYNNWLLKKDKSGGCLLDQHIHDVDTINWLFGKPDKVSTLAANIISGSGYDAVSTNYMFKDGKVINAQDDWTLNGDFGFQMLYRVNFEKGNLIYQGGKLTVNPNDAKSFTPELSSDTGYYREIRYFVDAVINNKEITVANPSSTMGTIQIAEKEAVSGDKNGELVDV